MNFFIRDTKKYYIKIKKIDNDNLIIKIVYI